MTSIMTRNKFSKLDYSDHLMLLRVLNAYSDCNPSSSTGFCRQNFLNRPAMTMIFGIRRQLFIELKRLHIVPHSSNNFDDSEFNQFSSSWPMIQGVIVAGCYPGIAFIRSGSKLRKIHPINCGSNGSTSASLASLHPSSSLRRQVQTNKRSEYLNECLKSECEPIIECVVYQELSKIDEGLTLRTVTAVPPIAAFLFAGPIRIQKFIVDDFELGEEDHDAHFFVQNEKEEEEVVQAPSFDEEDRLPSRYHREYYVETDAELVFKGRFRELQSALRLRFKLLSYFLYFLDKPLQPLSRENFSTLETVKTILEADHQKCFYNKVNDTLPTRPLQRNPPRQNNPSSSTGFCRQNFNERRTNYQNFCPL